MGETTLKQQWILGVGNEEPIHASSAQDKLRQLRTSHADKKIQLIMALQVIDPQINMDRNVQSLIKCDQY